MADVKLLITERQ